MVNRLKIIEFHFVLNKALKLKIEHASKLLKLSLSRTIIFIIENIMVSADKTHLIYPEENNKVEKINWDNHLHVYFSKEKQIIYNKLKSIHKDNNTYSIACKLRYLLKVFFRGIELYGLEKFLLILKRAEIKWEERKKKNKIWWKKKNIRQLNIKQNLIIHYAMDYTPIFIKLLN
jgi:hypothetical protein